ncbi:MAG TPA: tRNA preQ1(34) S-adenosylmethionine ribosyltransferase-isomerase QueA, partial [Longimicrobiales bacterium]
KPEQGYPTSAFDYELPRDRIARYPAARRDESRLMVLDRARNAIEHRRFKDIADCLQPGDALVLNETRVFPARILGKRESGAPAEVLLLHPHGDSDHVWEALVRPGAKLKPGRHVCVSDEFTIDILEATPEGSRIVRLATELPLQTALDRYGRVPLPPYLDRDAEDLDRERYQTVYAREEGSVAAPTAGLHFTPELLDAIAQKGVTIVRIVLHVGVGTFRPVEVEDPEQHVMHEELYTVTHDAVTAMAAVRARGGKLWAVGTTVARTLESVTDEQGTMHAGSGSTNLFIRPGYRFKAVDHLITNFHLPRSTLLMLVAAFGGYEFVMHAYREAVAGDYRFYSYGDAMAII